MANKEVKSRLADDISVSLNEALKFARGEKAERDRASRHAAQVRRPRSTHKTRPVAARIRVVHRHRCVGTVRKWELGTRRPSGATRTLIEVIKTEPKAVRRAMAKNNSAA